MGWLFKGFLALAGLLLLGAGLWWLSIVIFLYLVLCSRGGKQKVGRAALLTERGGGEDDDSARKRAGLRRALGSQWRWRYFLGGMFLVGAYLGVAAHGTFSPFVLGGVGIICFIWGPASRSGHVPTIGFSPIRESTMLRSRIIPFEWLTVAEIKLSSQESARALSVLHDTLVVVSSPSEKASAYLAIKVAAPTYRSAESQMVERLSRLAGLLSRRGAYLLPLDSSEAARRFRPGLEPLRLDSERDGVPLTVAHRPYDVLVVKPDGIHVKKLGAYGVTRAAKEAEVERVMAGNPEPPTGTDNAPPTRSASLPAAREPFEKPPLLWEVVSCLQERFQLAEPDGYVMFLNSMHLSRATPPGGKLTLKEARGSMVTVESLGGTPVDLTRAQLRTIVKIYG